MNKYSIIFTVDEIDDHYATTRGYRSDVLLQTEEGQIFDVNFVELAVIQTWLNTGHFCYMDYNLVILSSVTKSEILRSIPYIHRFQFHLHWMPLTDFSNLPPRNKWEIVEVIVEPND